MSFDATLVPAGRLPALHGSAAGCETFSVVKSLIIAAAAVLALLIAGFLFAPPSERWWLMGLSLPVIAGAALSRRPPPQRRTGLTAGVLTLLLFVPFRSLTRLLVGRALDSAASLQLFFFCLASAVVLTATTLLLSRQRDR